MPVGVHPGAVRRLRPRRTAAWQKRRREHLRELAARNPKLAYDAQRLGEVREDFDEFMGREAEIVAELRAEGFSLMEIGYTCFMYAAQIHYLLNAWKERTS